MSNSVGENELLMSLRKVKSYIDNNSIRLKKRDDGGIEYQVLTTNDWNVLMDPNELLTSLLYLKVEEFDTDVKTSCIVDAINELIKSTNNNYNAIEATNSKIDSLLEEIDTNLDTINERLDDLERKVNELLDN